MTVGNYHLNRFLFCDVTDQEQGAQSETEKIVGLLKIAKGERGGNFHEELKIKRGNIHDFD